MVTIRSYDSALDRILLQRAPLFKIDAGRLVATVTTVEELNNVSVCDLHVNYFDEEGNCLSREDAIKLLSL